MSLVEGVECKSCHSFLAVEDLELERDGSRKCPHCGAVVLDMNGEETE